MADRDDPLDALRRLLADDGPDWLAFFSPTPGAPGPLRRGTFRGDEREPSAAQVTAPVAIFHDVERGAGEHREVTLQLVETPLERGRHEIALAFAWPGGPLSGEARRHRVSCRLLVDGDVFDVDADHATCAWSEDRGCRLDLRLGQAWVERDRRPDALLAGLQGVLIVLEGGVGDDEAAADP